MVKPSYKTFTKIFFFLIRVSLVIPNSFRWFLGKSHREILDDIKYELTQNIFSKLTEKMLLSFFGNVFENSRKLIFIEIFVYFNFYL